MVKSPYKKSIWDQDSRYKIYDIEFSEDEKQIISRLMSVDAAKKNTPPIPIQGLLTISRLVKALPNAKDVNLNDIEDFIASARKVNGAGIPTIVCMLAVESEGDYPPMDKKFCSGLRKMNIISKKEQVSLNGGSKKKFSKIYVEKVIPAWVNSLQGRTPQEADNYWGRGGKDG